VVRVRGNGSDGMRTQWSLLSPRLTARAAPSPFRPRQPRGLLQQRHGRRRDGAVGGHDSSRGRSAHAQISRHVQVRDPRPRAAWCLVTLTCLPSRPPPPSPPGPTVRTGRTSRSSSPPAPSTAAKRAARPARAFCARRATTAQAGSR
jgi:hypothetical protein